ncbi:MAG TPA: acyloxyacyl hydrolase [Terriglobia bacterium]|nr:acyloxyacyl hydrolase [Terriglobia bacterium]
MAQPSVGFTLKDFHTRGFPVSRFSVVSEGILGGSLHPGGHLIGHALLFRLDGQPTHHVVPFFDFGAGVLHTSLADRAPELSGSTQFNPQGGLGIQYFFNPQRAFVFEYRYMHMSNNGIQEPNHGFNSSMITIGFRWLRRPHPPGWHPSHQHRGLGKFLFGKD